MVSVSINANNRLAPQRWDLTPCEQCFMLRMVGPRYLWLLLICFISYEEGNITKTALPWTLQELR